MALLVISSECPAGAPDSIRNMGGWAIVGVFINTLCSVSGIGNEHGRTSVNELCHYLLLPGLSVAFAYDRKQPPAFGASPHFLCTLLSLPGPSFRHTPSNFPNYNVFTNSNANAPLLYQIPGTWSNHEGSIPPRCRIPGFYGFPFRYRVQPHNVSERGRETTFCSFVSSSVKPEQRQSSGSGAEPPYRKNYGFEQARTLAPALLYNYSKGWRGRKEGTIHLSHYIRGWGGAPTFLRVRSTAPAPASASASTSSWAPPRPFYSLPPNYLSGEGPYYSKAPTIQLNGGWGGSRATLHPIYSGGGPFRVGGGPLEAAPLLILGLRRPRNSSDRTRRSRKSRSTSREIARNRTLNRLSALLDRNIEIGRRGPFHALLDRGGSGGSRAPTYIRSARSGLGATPTIHRVLHLARDAEERAEQRISGAVGIALFSPLFPSASSNPLVRNSFVRTESLAESNPVLQDPVLAIHPPCIYAGDVASAMGFGLCIYKMMNGIVALYSPMQREGNAALCSAGCGAPPLYNGGFLTQYQSTGGQSIGGGVVECSARPLPGNYNSPPPELSPPNYLGWVGGPSVGFKGESSSSGNSYGGWAPTILRRGRGPDIGRGPIGRGTLCRTAGANTVVSDPKRDRERIRIRIPTRRRFFTVGILPGSWWAHHELGRGGRWFRDPVENASPMPWVLATARIHPVILPKVYLWTSFPNIVTFSCRVLGTFLVRSGLLASVHSPATDSTRGIFSWRFLLLITGISPILFFQIRGHRSIERTLFSKPLTVRRSFMRSCYQWDRAFHLCP